MSRMTRARGYLRISDDREGREIGVGRQEESIRDLAQRLNADLLDPLYVDNDVSASTLSKAPRPAYERLMAEAAADPGSLVLSYSNSRLSRRPSEWDDLIKLYETAGVVIHTVASGSADLSRADGRAIARTIAAWDAAEAERTGERVYEDVVRRANAGLFHGGSRAFGWTTSNDFDPYEHPILVELAERVRRGEALNALATELTHRGVPGAKWHPPLTIKPWRAHVIRQMLTNPRIAGIRVLNDVEVGRAVWPAAIPEPMFREIKAMLTDGSRHSGGSPGRVNLLTGLALCGECDRPVSSKTMAGRGGQRRQYACKPCGLYRRVEAIHVYVESAVVEMLTHYQDEDPDADPAALELIRNLRDRIEATKRTFTGDDTMSPMELRRQLRGMQDRLKREEAKLLPTRRRNVLQGITGDMAAEAWGSLTLARKRAIIAALVEVRIRRAPAGRKPFDPATVEVNPRM